MPRGSRCRGCDFRSRCTCPSSALAFVYPGICKRTLGLEGVMPDETANLFEIMATTRSMRRLKPDPVPAELIRKILKAGVSAPSGGNMQRWRFLVIRDPKVKQTVGAFYRRAWDEQVAPRYRAGEPAPGTSRERFARMLDAAQYLADHIHEALVRWMSFRYSDPGAGFRPRRIIDEAPQSI